MSAPRVTARNKQDAEHKVLEEQSALPVKNLFPAPAADRRFERVVALPKKNFRGVDFPQRHSTYR